MWSPAIAAITKAARSGNIGDGKIFVVPLKKCPHPHRAKRVKAAIG
jgi:nitrogen regulatory protein PII